MTSKEIIIEILSRSPKPIACHEFNIVGHSENAIASRLAELAKEGRIGSRYRKGYHYKEWFILTPIEFKQDSTGQRHFQPKLRGIGG